jgi:uncharacterized protein (DUF4415 family)
MGYEWDPAKAGSNLAKHGVRFADAVRSRRTMNNEYDFSQGRRGALDPLPRGKTRITIRLDDDVLDWFRDQADASGGGNYQTMINAALREYIAGVTEPLEDTLRRVVREELGRSA